MEQAFFELARRVLRGEDGALALVVESSGSVPRGAGAAMAVFAGGETCGTVGGGAVEHRCTEIGTDMLGASGARLEEFELTPAGAADLGMVCGGNVNVLFQSFCGGDENAARLFRALSDADDSAPTWFAVCFEKENGEARAANALLAENGEMIATDAPGGAFPAGAYKGLLLAAPELDGENGVFYHAQPLLGQGVVYIFGAGHVAQKLAAQLALVDFACVVTDDRAEFANEALFPTAKQVIVCEFDEVFARLDIRRNDYVVIMTRGHKSDHVVLVQALGTPARYIGMIGSMKKVGTSFTRLILNDGFTYADTRRVCAPIGLMIGDETPAEIAVSIAAQLIQKRAAKK